MKKEDENAIPMKEFKFLCQAFFKQYIAHSILIILLFL